MHLPNSPVRKVHECRKCGDVSLKFWNPLLTEFIRKKSGNPLK